MYVTKTIFLTKTVNYFTIIIKPSLFFDTGLPKPKVYIVIKAYIRVGL